MVNYAQDKALAGSASGGSADPSDRLVDAYNIRFMSGQMSPFMRDALRARLEEMTAGDYGSVLGRERVQHLLYLIISSAEYSIQKCGAPCTSIAATSCARACAPPSVVPACTRRSATSS
jgi:hypothetical protein